MTKQNSPFYKGGRGDLILQRFWKKEVSFYRDTACRVQHDQKVKISPALFTKEGGGLHPLECLISKTQNPWVYPSGARKLR